jgi:hypothetical protein
VEEDAQRLKTREEVLLPMRKGFSILRIYDGGIPEVFVRKTQRKRNLFPLDASKT